MRGFLSLEPDEATLARLVAAQNRLRDGLTRQGVHFPDRLGVTLLTWPFATFDQLFEAATRLVVVSSDFRLEPLAGRPGDDRPGEVGFALLGTETLQSELARRLKEPLDPDPPKPPFLRLARVSPPSRKVGTAFSATGLGGHDAGPFVARGFAIWNQTPQGYEVCRTMRWGDGRP